MSNHVVFKQYDTNKYMAMNTAIEIDIIDRGDHVTLETSDYNRQFPTFLAAAKFADQAFETLK